MGRRWLNFQIQVGPQPGPAPDDPDAPDDPEAPSVCGVVVAVDTVQPVYPLFWDGDRLVVLLEVPGFLLGASDHQGLLHLQALQG